MSTIRIAVLSVTAALLLGGCGGPADVNPVYKGFSSPTEVRAAYIDAGGTCGKFKLVDPDDAPVDGVVDGFCGDRWDTPMPSFIVADSPELLEKQRQSEMRMDRPDGEHRVVVLEGPNWLVKSFTTDPDDLDAIAAEMGAKVWDASKLPSVELVYTQFDKTPYMRFAAVVKNPTDRPLRGVVTEWTAFGDGYQVLGSHQTTQPVIAGGQTVAYVGGAGMNRLTAEPTSVSVNVVSYGEPASEYRTYNHPVSVTSAKVRKGMFDKKSGSQDYVVDVSLRATFEAKTQDQSVPVLLFDKKDNVVGADWVVLDGEQELLKPDDVLNVSTTVAVDAGDKPVRASAFAYTN